MRAFFTIRPQGLIEDHGLGSDRVALCIGPRRGKEKTHPGDISTIPPWDLFELLKPDPEAAANLIVRIAASPFIKVPGNSLAPKSGLLLRNKLSHPSPGSTPFGRSPKACPSAPRLSKPYPSLRCEGFPQRARGTNLLLPRPFDELRVWGVGWDVPIPKNKFGDWCDSEFFFKRIVGRKVWFLEIYPPKPGPGSQ